MKKFIKKLTVLGILTCLCLTACGKTEQTKPAKEETVSEETNKTKETDNKPNESNIKLIDCGSVVDYVSKEDNKVCYYSWFKVQNTTNNVLKDAKFNVIIKNKAGEMVDNEEVVVGAIYPGETALDAAYFETTVDFIQNDAGAGDIKLIDGNFIDASKFNGFSQADLTIEDIATKHDDTLGTECTLSITNNNADSGNKLSYVNVLCKKDGKAVGYISEALTSEIKPGITQALKLGASDRVPGDCDDFDVFVDYLND